MIIPYRKFPFRGSIIYRPTLQIKLKLNYKSISTWALIDSGADKTIINKMLGKQLGYDFVVNRPTSATRGIAGKPQPVWDSQLEMEVEGIAGNVFTSNIAYMQSDNFGILLGHEGFFEFFEIKFQTAKKQFEIELASKS